MILELLAIRTVADLLAVKLAECDHGRDCERNSLVRRPEDRVDADRQLFVVDLGLDLLRIEAAERGDLLAVVKRARIDELRGLTAGLQREVTEFERVRFVQELGESMVE